jgi:ATP adenylyltransferase
MRYVGGAEPAGCLFCRIAEPAQDRRHLVLARRPHALIVLNRFPYNPAHLMVAVVRHVARFGRLTAAEREDVWASMADAEAAITKVYRPHGFNVGANLGRVAGAGFPGHLHMHVVPRWNGDTNFMPVMGKTKVLPESLERTWSRLREVLGEPESKGRARARRGSTRARLGG